MGGSSSGSTYDKAYNDRMASLSEQEVEMAQKAFDVYDFGTSLQQGGTGTSGAIGSGSGLEIAQNTAAQGLLPYQVDAEKSNLSTGIKSNEYKSELMNKFYSKIGQNSESQAVSQARGDVAGAISQAKSTAARDAQRRGVAPSAGGIGLEGAKLNVGAMSTARDNTRKQNLSEYSQGLTI